MPTLNQQKKSDFEKWVTTAKIELKDFSRLDTGENNELHHVIQKVVKTCH